MASSVTPTQARAQSSEQPTTRSIKGIRFLGTGSFTPENVVPNEALSRLGCDAEWIVQRTGILERRHAPPEMATSDMAYEAARRCLENSQVDPGEVDLLIVATITPDYFTPSTSCLIQPRLGLSCPCFDMNAACAGFLYGMITGCQFVANGSFRHVLVVGADVMSRVANPDDVKTFPLFGDAAGAVMLGGKLGQSKSSVPNPHISMSGSSPISPTLQNGQNRLPDESSPEYGVLSYTLGAEGDTEGLLRVPGGAFRERPTVETIVAKRNFLVMDGRPVFKWAVRKIGQAIVKVLEDANLKGSDIDLVVFHQANIRIIDAAVEHLGFPRDRVFVNVNRYGNTSAASVALALDEANRQERIQNGDKVLFCGFGAGLTWGTCVVQWQGR